MNQSSKTREALYRLWKKFEADPDPYHRYHGNRLARTSSETIKKRFGDVVRSGTSPTTQDQTKEKKTQ